MESQKGVIPIDMKRRILFPLVSLVDAGDQYEAGLKQAGFSAFMPYKAFFKIFLYSGRAG